MKQVCVRSLFLILAWGILLSCSPVAMAQNSLTSSVARQIGMAKTKGELDPRSQLSITRKSDHQVLIRGEVASEEEIAKVRRVVVDYLVALWVQQSGEGNAPDSKKVAEKRKEREGWVMTEIKVNPNLPVPQPFSFPRTDNFGSYDLVQLTPAASDSPIDPVPNQQPLPGYMISHDVAIAHFSFKALFAYAQFVDPSQLPDKDSYSIQRKNTHATPEDNLMALVISSNDFVEEDLSDDLKQELTSPLAVKIVSTKTLMAPLEHSISFQPSQSLAPDAFFPDLPSGLLPDQRDNPNVSHLSLTSRIGYRGKLDLLLSVRLAEDMTPSKQTETYNFTGHIELGKDQGVLLVPRRALFEMLYPEIFSKQAEKKNENNNSSEISFPANGYEAILEADFGGGGYAVPPVSKPRTFPKKKIPIITISPSLKESSKILSFQPSEVKEHFVQQPNDFVDPDQIPGLQQPSPYPATPVPLNYVPTVPPAKPQPDLTETQPTSPQNQEIETLREHLSQLRKDVKLLTEILKQNQDRISPQSRSDESAEEFLPTPSQEQISPPALVDEPAGSES